MDHLQKPKNNIPPLEFPYHSSASYAIKEYSKDSWIAYPSRHGWDLDVIRRGDLDGSLKGRRRDELATFLQSWLYFGLAATILETPIEVSDFTGWNEAGERILRTTSLTRHIQEWANLVKIRGRHASEIARREDRDAKGDILNFAARFMATLQSLGAPKDAAFSLIGLSVAILATALGNAVVHIYRARPNPEGVLKLPRFSFGFGGLVLNNRMRQLNWCRSDIIRLTKNALIPGLCYGSMISRDEDGITHEKCDDYGCVANNVLPGTYVPQHASHAGDCQCHFIGLPSGSAENVLEAGGIPLVRLWKGITGIRERRFDVVRYEPGMHYTALSHVWSDGLGDEKGNRIASCQFDRIAGLLCELSIPDAEASVHMPGLDKHENQVSGAWTTPFWLDTLCVPHTPVHRKLACQRMAKSYELASIVLVLDSELQRWQFKDADDSEALLRICVSGWMRRVWTLSEGVLAKCLIVKFADGLFDVSKAVARIGQRSLTEPECFQTIPREMCAFFLAMENISKLEGAERFENAWLATQTRQTSHQGDEIISTAILLRLNPVPLLEINQDMNLRMQTFLSQLPQLPRGILFSMVPRLRTLGFRWAPSSLYGGTVESTGSPGLMRTERGLLIDSFGLMLSGSWRDPDNGSFLCRDSQNEVWYRISKWCGWHRNSEHLPTEAEKLEDKSSVETTRLALVVQAREINFGSRAVLLSHVSEDSSTLNGRYQRLVWIQIADKGDFRDIQYRNKRALSSEDRKNRSSNDCQGTWTATPRCWCIG
jgi:hypothetical protein